MTISIDMARPCLDHDLDLVAVSHLPICQFGHPMSSVGQLGPPLSPSYPSGGRLGTSVGSQRSIDRTQSQTIHVSIDYCMLLATTVPFALRGIGNASVIGIGSSDFVCVTST